MLKDWMAGWDGINHSSQLLTERGPWAGGSPLLLSAVKRRLFSLRGAGEHLLRG